MTMSNLSNPDMTSSNAIGVPFKIFENPVALSIVLLATSKEISLSNSGRLGRIFTTVALRPKVENLCIFWVFLCKIMVFDYFGLYWT